MPSPAPTAPDVRFRIRRFGRRLKSKSFLGERRAACDAARCSTRRFPSLPVRYVLFARRVAGAYGPMLPRELGAASCPPFGPSSHCMAISRPLLTPACPSFRPRERTSFEADMQASWGKTRDLHPMYPAASTALGYSMTFGLRSRSLPHPLGTPHALRVPRVRTLRPASSPPPLAGTRSCLQLGVPVIGPPGDLHPQVTSRSAFAFRLPTVR